MLPLDTGILHASVYEIIKMIFDLEGVMLCLLCGDDSPFAHTFNYKLKRTKSYYDCNHESKIKDETQNNETKMTRNFEDYCKKRKKNALLGTRYLTNSTQTTYKHLSLGYAISAVCLFV